MFDKLSYITITYIFLIIVSVVLFISLIYIYYLIYSLDKNIFIIFLINVLLLKLVRKIGEILNLEFDKLKNEE